MSRTFDALGVKIKKDTGYSTKDFKRLYPGYWQRKSGFPVWTALLLNDAGHIIGDISSPYTARQLLQADKLECNKNFTIYPTN